MEVSAGREVRLHIEKPAVGGEGVARAGGVVVFVEGGLPGDVVRARVDSVAKRFVRATALEVLEPGPGRVAPECPHVPECGGCSWQELDYAEQLRWKRVLVQDSLERVGRFDSLEAEPAAPSPERFGFRNKMEFAFGPGAGEEPLHLGLRRRRSHGIVDIETCLLQTPETPALVRAVREYCRSSGAPAWDPETRRGYWRHLVVRSNERGEHLVHVITAPDRRRKEAAEGLLDMLAGRPEVVGAVLSLRRHPAQVAEGERIVMSRGRDSLDESLGHVRYGVSAGAFFQTNTRGAELLYGVVRELAGLSGTEAVLDLFCGNGGISLFLAREAGAMLGLELHSGAVADARTNAAANGLSNCRFSVANLAKGLPEQLESVGPEPDVVIVDPPRSGMDKRLAADLLALAPRRIVSVSCDPATHARDLAILAGKYAIRRVVPVDLFPHSPHVESAALLERSGQH